MASIPEPLELQQLRIKLARAMRFEGANDPDTVAIKREYETARTAHVIQERLTPLAPLTASEVGTLTALIAGYATGGTSAGRAPKQRQAMPDTEPLFELDMEDDA